MGLKFNSKSQASSRNISTTMTLNSNSGAIRKFVFVLIYFAMSTTYCIVVKKKGFIQSIIKGNETPMNYGKLHIEMTQICIIPKAACICFIWMLAET